MLKNNKKSENLQNAEVFIIDKSTNQTTNFGTIANGFLQG